MDTRKLLAVAAACLVAGCSSTSSSDSASANSAPAAPKKLGATANVNAKATAGSGTPVWQKNPGGSDVYINSVAISGDGSRVVGGTFAHNYGGTVQNRVSADPKAPGGKVTGTGTFGVYMFDSTGAQKWSDVFSTYDGVYWVDISNDGAYAAAGGWMSNSPWAGFIRAYNATTGQNLLTFATASRVNQVQLSKDGTWLVAGAESLTLFKLGTNGYTNIANIPVTGTNAYIVTLAMSADGKYVVTADSNKNLTLWENFATQLAIVKQSTVPDNGYSHCLRMTPDGSAFVSGGMNGNFYYFKTSDFQSTGAPTATQNFSGGKSVYGVAIADDGSGYVGMTNNGEAGLVRYVSLTSSTTWTFNTQRNPNCASINTLAGVVAVADGHPDGTPGHFYSINLATGAQNWVYQTGNMSWPIEFATNGQAIAAGSDDSYIYYFTP